MPKKWISVLFSLLAVQSFSQQTNALHFDGINDYVNLNSLQQPVYNNRSHFTIEFWMKGKLEDQTSSIRTSMFAINEPAGENRLLFIMGGPSNQDGKLMIYNNGSWGPNAIYTSSVIIGDGECHHIAYSYNNANCKVYIDGVLVDTHYAPCPITANDRYSLGQEYDNLETSQFFNGEIDDFRIWNVVRTSAEIADNMNQELSGNEPGLLAYYSFNQGLPGGLNYGIDELLDLTATSADGYLMNFAFNGSISNWVRGLCVEAFLTVEENIATLKPVISLYPNPAQNLITITWSGDPQEAVDLLIFTCTGQLIFQTKVTGNQFLVDISDWENGTYLVQLEYRGITSQCRMIKTS